MRPVIIYIYPEYSSFVGKDIKFLEKNYTVLAPDHDWVNKQKTPFNFIKQFIFLAGNINRCKAVFVMFGGYWSFLPVLLGKLAGKPVYIIPGGTDCVSFPALKYGSLRKPLMKIFIRWSYQMCSRLLPVHESLMYCDYSYYENSDYSRQGIKFFFPGLTTPYQVIYNGFDPLFFNPQSGEKVSNSFVTVAIINNMTRVVLKGIDLILYLGEAFKNCSFTVIGITDEVISRLGSVPSNVTRVPFLAREKFIHYLSDSQFVLQLSVSEGFPNSLCEAMLCRCIPIGSSVGAIPDIIGDTGYVIKSSARDHLLAEFKEIISTDSRMRSELSHKARERIAEHFHIDKREKAFIRLIESGQHML